MDLLIERAVRANYDLRLALGRLHEARATRSGAMADFGPTIGISAAYTRENLSKDAQPVKLPPQIPGEKLDYNDYDAHFDATWELDIFGSKRRTLEADTDTMAADREDVRDTLPDGAG